MILDLKGEVSLFKLHWQLQVATRAVAVTSESRSRHLLLPLTLAVALVQGLGLRLGV